MFALALLVSLAAAPPEAAVRTFDLTDTAGKVRTVKEWDGAKAVVLLYLSAECPSSNGYSPELTRIATAFEGKPVLFFGIHADPDISREQAARHAKEYELPFPVLLDPTQAVARQAGVTRVPTAVVLAPDGKVQYRGRIDDRYLSLGKKRDQPTTRDLHAAIEAVLAGKSPPTRETEVIGCLLPKRD